MDEIKEGKQGNSERTSSAAETEITSDKKGKTFTEAQHSKILSDTKAEFGRERAALTKERDSLKSQVESASSRLDALERQISEVELEGIRENPELLKAYQQRQDLGKKMKDLDIKERELAQREAQVRADSEAIKADREGAIVARVAVKHGLNIQQVESWGITDEEALDKIAGDFAKAKPKAGEVETTPDSGMSSGSLSSLAMREKANKDFSEGKITEKQFREIVGKLK